MSTSGVCRWLGEPVSKRERRREAARAAIFEYIEVFNNRQRIHSRIGCVSHERFEASRR